MALIWQLLLLLSDLLPSLCSDYAGGSRFRRWQPGRVTSYLTIRTKCMHRSMIMCMSFVAWLVVALVGTQVHTSFAWCCMEAVVAGVVTSRVGLLRNHR